MYTIRMLYQKINGFFLRSWYNGPGPLYLRTNRVMCPWAWSRSRPVPSTLMVYNKGWEKCVRISRERRREALV